ncbi:hypothetical protein JOD44_001053 [Salimicrobium jeotgali]|nr:hypothetical protein [Salimicrobium jeotgali]
MGKLDQKTAIINRISLHKKVVQETLHTKGGHTYEKTG